eukprot:gene15352-20687_t
MATIQQLAAPTEGISCHAWNRDKTMLAISPNSNEIHIYETNTWRKIDTLTEHDLQVSAIDWSAATNKIVSCSHDRNAFVWTYEPEVVEGGVTIPAYWKPALVILRIDKAAIDVKWSADGSRFAVASGAKVVPVCTYDSLNDWWVCKMVKAFKSTVLCCAFHPTNGQVLATGCADFKCRIFSTFASDVDGTNVDPRPFSSPVEFGKAYVELGSLGWIHSVAWSPSGNVLCYSGHDSTIHFALLGGQSEPIIQSLRLPGLPICSLLFLGENALVGGGHDFVPLSFTKDQGGKWNFLANLDEEAVKLKGDSSENVAATSGVSAARELFKNKTVRGQDNRSDGDALRSFHENCITEIRVANSSSNKGVTSFSTSSLDGRLVLWNLPSLSGSSLVAKLQSLAI